MSDVGRANLMAAVRMVRRHCGDLPYFDGLILGIARAFERKDEARRQIILGRQARGEMSRTQRTAQIGDYEYMEVSHAGALDGQWMRKRLPWNKRNASEIQNGSFVRR